MKRLSWILLLPLAASCPAQNQCNTSILSQAAARTLALEKELKQTKVDAMDVTVSPAAAERITQLKDALSRTSDAALACAKPSVDPNELQKSLARLLHANAPEPAISAVNSNDNRRSDEVLGVYGNDLQVQVTRPTSVAGIIEIQYSTSIACGQDSMLLVYAIHGGTWTEELRWQSPPLKGISDAFGDFLLTAFLPGLSALGGGDTKWRVAVAHGTSWCTSRFSHFRIDLLAPGHDPASPEILWNTARGYSRFTFDPWLKSSGNTFELRLNDDCMMLFSDNCFERRVIYRYSIDGDDHVRRVGPIAINARGFVEEWLSAPWSESMVLSVVEAAPELQKVHDQFFELPKPSDDHFLSHSLGPVRACAVPGTFQVQINSKVEKIDPRKPEKLTPLPSYYFHLREGKDGYMMLSAPTEPDPTCSGANLMPAGKE
jgi:hypothetical protein